MYIDAVLTASYTLSTCKDVDLTYVPATTDLASTICYYHRQNLWDYPVYFSSDGLTCETFVYSRTRENAKGKRPTKYCCVLGFTVLGAMPRHGQGMHANFIPRSAGDGGRPIDLYRQVY